MNAERARLNQSLAGGRGRMSLGVRWGVSATRETRHLGPGIRRVALAPGCRRASVGQRPSPNSGVATVAASPSHSISSLPSTIPFKAAEVLTLFTLRRLSTLGHPLGATAEL